ncbi:helix-turn-helix domain-containing protein [Marinilabilia salmonicolor]|uniref:helix-turn-helix domain-containing protein n=1 Tax=Marinilabilia salmonicolor TaxID=989 RepID=UPI00029ACB2A|nr:helix-turn-helix transcriptional regulator [Marinilabilia salmonicolor]
MFKIKEIAKEKGITLDELAQRLNMHRVSLSRIIGKNSNPTVKSLQKIADVLEVDLIDLFDASESTNREVIYIKQNGKFLPAGHIEKSKLSKVK